VAESTVRWFGMREKHCWMAADSADKLKRTRRCHQLGPYLDAKFFLKFYYVKRRFYITSKYRYMHGVLNVDEIKNKLHSLVVLYETNLLSLIS
jgi:hypothetical protein